MSDVDQVEGEAPAEDTTHVETPEAAEGQDAQSGNDAPAEQSEAPKPKKTVQDRIDELTRKAREAERDAEYWRSRVIQPEARQEQAPEPQGDGKPDPTQYAEGVYDAAYIEDLTDWKAERAVERVMSTKSASEKAQTVEEAWKSRVAEAAKATPDLIEALNGDWACTPEMAATIKESELGAEVAYQLAKDPAEARRIAGLTPLAQARELGRIEARLERPKTPPAKTTTDAPEPTPKLRGAGGQYKVAPDTDDFAAFEKTYP